jgi:hypothetical protein
MTRKLILESYGEGEVMNKAAKGGYEIVQCCCSSLYYEFIVITDI